jgi:hypothetical protein
MIPTTTQMTFHQQNLEYARKEDDDYLNEFIDNDVPMQMIREVSGQKRTLGKPSSTSEQQSQIGLNTSSSPQRSPPTKREKPSNKPSANPDEASIRARGEP